MQIFSPLGLSPQTPQLECTPPSTVTGRRYPETVLSAFFLPRRNLGCLDLLGGSKIKAHGALRRAGLWRGALPSRSAGSVHRSVGIVGARVESEKSV